MPLAWLIGEQICRFFGERIPIHFQRLKIPVSYWVRGHFGRNNCDHFREMTRSLLTGSTILCTVVHSSALIATICARDAISFLAKPDEECRLVE